MLVETSSSRSGWQEVPQWQAKGIRGTFDSAGAFDETSGRFLAPVAGFYDFSANLVVDIVKCSAFIAAIFVDGDHLTPGVNSLHWVDEDPGQVASASLVGQLYLDAGQYVSLHAYSDADDVWFIRGTSGFSGHFAGHQEENFGWHSSLPDDSFSVPQKGWHAIDGPWLDVIQNTEVFSPEFGAFQATVDGFYHFTAHLCVDKAQHFDLLRAGLFIDGNTEPEDGRAVRTIRALPSETTMLSLSGDLHLEATDRVTVWLSSDADAEYNLIGHHCHFSGHFIGSNVTAFSRRKGVPLSISARGWHEISGPWSSGLHEAGGRFTAAVAGVYHVSTEVILDGADVGIYQIAVLVNGKLPAGSIGKVQNGLQAFTQNPAEVASLSVAGDIELQEGDYVSVWISSNQDKTFEVHKDSIFSGHQVLAVPAWPTTTTSTSTTSTSMTATTVTVTKVTQTTTASTAAPDAAELLRRETIKYSLRRRTVQFPGAKKRGGLGRGSRR